MMGEFEAQAVANQMESGGAFLIGCRDMTFLLAGK